MKGNIPSPRKLKLKRFERPDFRCTTKRSKRGAGWTWSRLLYRLRRFNQQWNAVLDRDIVEPLRVIVRAVAALKAHHPVWQRRNVSRETFKIGEVVTASMLNQAIRQPEVVRAPRSMRWLRSGMRQSKPARSTARRKGAARHRLENLTTLPHQAYLSALNARQAYVIANLLRLKGLAARRAFGEPTWREQRRADHYATA